MVCAEWVGVTCSGNDLPREGDSWKSGISGSELYAVCSFVCLFVLGTNLFLVVFPFPTGCVFMIDTSLKLHIQSIGCVMIFKLGSKSINSDCMSLLSYAIGVGRHAIF